MVKLNEILAISGQSGLFKYVAGGKNGIIVESMADKRRFTVSKNAKVSSFGDIAVFTMTEDVPLVKVLENMSKVYELKEAINHKSETALLQSEFERVLPDYDKERVHLSDMKKIFAWYNILISAGVVDFTVKQEEQEA